MNKEKLDSWKAVKIRFLAAYVRILGGVYEKTPEQNILDSMQLILYYQDKIQNSGFRVVIMLYYLRAIKSFNSVIKNTTKQGKCPFCGVRIKLPCPSHVLYKECPNNSNGLLN